MKTRSLDWSKLKDTNGEEDNDDMLSPSSSQEQKGFSRGKKESYRRKESTGSRKDKISPNKQKQQQQVPPSAQEEVLSEDDFMTSQYNRNESNEQLEAVIDQDINAPPPPTNTQDGNLVEGSMTGGNDDETTASGGVLTATSDSGSVVSNKEKFAKEGNTSGHDIQHRHTTNTAGASKDQNTQPDSNSQPGNRNPVHKHASMPSMIDTKCPSEDSDSLTSIGNGNGNDPSNGNSTNVTPKNGLNSSLKSSSSMLYKDRMSSRHTGFDSSGDETSEVPEEQPYVEFDEAEQVDVLPLYLIGGVTTAGFHQILGNALSLLYVARHGLKENELWSMLCTLPTTSTSSSDSSHGGGGGGSSDQNSISSALSSSSTITPEVKALLDVCYYYREQFLTVWKSDDLLHTGRLSCSKLLTGMKMVNPEFTHKDLEMLLFLLNVQPSIVFSTVSSMGNHKTVDYTVLCDKIKRGKRVAQMGDIKKKNKTFDNSEIESINDLEDPLFNAVQIGEELDGFAVTSAEDINAVKSLGPVLEEGLLSALCALGVSHSPKDQVIVLPCENEQLRNVILERYILSHNGTPKEWHMRLIHFFQRKKHSLRRCEELPWHLKICRRWHSLRNVLSDLRTFNIMAQGHLRDELLNYWMLLTHAPLYTTDQAEQDASSANRVQLNDNMRILSEIDSATALHLTPKEIKKQLLKDCVANFDIVEDMEKTVEAWITRTGPSGTKIAKMIMFIATFLAEYCRLFEASTPPFLRLGMEQKFFTMFNIQLEGTGSDGEETGAGGNKTLLDDDKNLPNAPLGSNSQSNEHSDPDDELKKVLAKATPVGNNVTNLSKDNAHLYMYYRWIWIQFPWLAMPSSSAHLASLITKNGKAVNVLAQDNAGGGGGGGGGSGNPLTKPPTNMMKLESVSGNSQLNMNASSMMLGVGEAGMNNSSHDNTNLNTNNGNNSINKKVQNPTQDSFMDFSGGLATSGGGNVNRRIANRSWAVNKLDPSKSSIIKPSVSRNASIMKTSLGSSTVTLDAIDSFSKHVLDRKYTNVIAGGDDSGNSSHAPRDKFRTSLKDHTKHMSTIPFSKPSQRTLRTGTLFPSVQDNFTAQHAAKMKDMDDFSRQASAKYGGMNADDEEKHNFKNEMEHIQKVEKLKALNNRDNSAIPSADALAVIRVLENEKSGKLRKAFDNVVQIRKQKEAQMQEMYANYVIRDDVDEEVLATLHAADDTMNQLEDRYVSLQSALTEAKALNTGYAKLISFLNVNQPSTETHMQSLEQEVHLAYQQCNDLKSYRTSIYEDTEKLEKITIKNLKQKLQNTKSQRVAVQKKVKLQKGIHRDLQAELQNADSDLRYLQHINRPNATSPSAEAMLRASREGGTVPTSSGNGDRMKK